MLTCTLGITGEHLPLCSSPLMLVSPVQWAPPVLLDCGTEGNFIDSGFTVQLGLPKISLLDPLNVLAITGAPLIQIQIHLYSMAVFQALVMLG